MKTEWTDIPSYQVCNILVFLPGEADPDSDTMPGNIMPMSKVARANK